MPLLVPKIPLIDVTLSSITQNNITATWNNPSGATLFEVFKRVGGVATFVAETSALTYDISATPSTLTTIEIYCVSNAGYAFTTTPAPTYVDSYSFIQPDGITEQTDTLSAPQTYAAIITNVQTDPIQAISISGLSTSGNQASVLGCTIGTGSVNQSSFTANTWTQVTLGSSNSWTPGNGSTTSRKYWKTDEVTLPSPLTTGQSCIIKLAVSAGNITYPQTGAGGCRPNFNDFSTGYANQSGDFGSSPSNAVLTPSGGWNLGTAMFEFGFELLRHSTVDHKRHAAFGDSVIQGISGSPVRDTWAYTAMQNMTGNVEIVSFGRGGITVQDQCSIFIDWLTSGNNVSLFDSCSLIGWSWNNLDTDANGINSALDSAMAAGAAAGKRMSIWYPTPAGLQLAGYGNNISRTQSLEHASTRGWTIIDTSASIADGTDPTKILASLTPEGVHLNQAGQVIMGQQIALHQTPIFG